MIPDPSSVSNARSALSRLQSALGRAGDLLIRQSIRLAPTEAQRTLGVTLLVGAACGLLAVTFHGAILPWSAR